MQEPLHRYLQRLRHARGKAWSQQRLAKEAGVAPSTISRLERGEGEPDYATLAKVAPFYGTTVGDIWHRAGKADPPAAVETPGTLANAIYRALMQLGVPDPARDYVMSVIEREAPAVVEERELVGCAGGQ